MVRWVVAAWYLVSIWGCAHPMVQPYTQERSAIAFAQKVLKEMSQGLEKPRVSLGATLQEKGTYRLFAADFYPHNVTTADLMQNFARFCTQIGDTMVQSVCQAGPEEANQVKFLVHIEDQSAKNKQFVRLHVMLYEPLGAPSAEFLRAIRPYQ